MKLLPNHSDAVALYEIFKQNDLNLDKKSYADQSVLLDKLIAELDKSENKERLKRLNLDTAFADLKTKQETFSRLISEQTEANTELRLTKSASAVRKDLGSVIRNYLGFCNDNEIPTRLGYPLQEVVKNKKIIEKRAKITCPFAFL